MHATDIHSVLSVSTQGPRWRYCSTGLNAEGVCTNAACEAHGKMIIDRKVRSALHGAGCMRYAPCRCAQLSAWISALFLHRPVSSCKLRAILATTVHYCAVQCRYSTVQYQTSLMCCTEHACCDA